MGHAHHQWLLDASDDIQRDYGRLYAKAADPRNTQSVGHENEAIWAEFLTNWLPPQYEVATRRYIVGGSDSDAVPFETDLIVFDPSYPRKLREKTHVLAAGVAAAFSTKLTIRTAGLSEAAEQSSALQRALAPSYDPRRRVLWKPYVFGVLAASHSWKSDGSSPLDNVSKCLAANDKKHAAHPAESLDLVLIADLGFWGKTTTYTDGTLEGMVGLDDRESLDSGHMEMATDPMNPLSLFLGALYEFLSWQNVDMKGIARSFQASHDSVSGRAFRRSWDVSEVLGASSRTRMSGGEFTRNEHNSWNQGAM